MKDTIEKLREIEIQTSDEKGPYRLFAVFLREDTDKWDILVSASWISASKEKSLKYLAAILQKSFDEKELLLFSSIIFIEENNPALTDLFVFSAEHNSIEIKNSTFNELKIKHAFLITSMNR